MSLAARNLRTDANALPVTADDLNDFYARFQPPLPDEGAEASPSPRAPTAAR
jgi:hypothetical protein